MRMFLIGMCDIFLLLYLTAVAELESRPVSTLTVNDYIKLQASESDYRARTEQAEKDALALQRELEAKLQEIAAKERAVSATAEKLAVVQSELSETEAAKARLEQSDAQKQLAFDAFVAAEREAAQREEQLQRDVALISEKLRSETEERERQAARAHTMMKAVEEEEARRKAESERAEVEEKRAQEALAEARRLREEADAALARADRASQAEKEAQRRASAARAREEKAVQYAGQAVDAARQAHEDSARAMKRAQEASREKLSATERLKAVVRSPETAFDELVAGSLTQFAVVVERDGTFGTSTDRTVLRSPAVRFGSQSVVLVPLAQIRAAEASDVRDIISIRIETESWNPTVALVNPRAGLLAIALPRSVTAVKPSSAADVNQMTPTLFAVRNGARQRFNDRVRGVSESRILINRDRLALGSSGELSYRVQGFRGTGDFGEQILPGDHLLDLTGAYIGTATGTNRVQRVRSIDSWKELPLTGSTNVGERFSEMLGASGS